MVTTVHSGRRPAVHAEPGGDPAGPAVGGGLVVDHDRGQAAQPGGASVGDRLMVGALVQLGVTNQDVGAAAKVLDALVQRDADRDRQPVPERSAGDLHTRHQHPIGVVAQW
jgi:hypothetical protein